MSHAQQLLRLDDPDPKRLAQRYAPHILAFLRTKPTEHSPFPRCELGERHPQLPPYEGSEWDLSRCVCGCLWRLSDLKRHVYRALHGYANGDSTSRILRMLRQHGPTHRAVGWRVDYEATRGRGGVYRLVEIERMELSDAGSK